MTDAAMRPIHLAHLDKTRPVLVLTRDTVRPLLNTVTIAPITTTVRGLSTELAVGLLNGLDEPAVVSLDNVTTIPVKQLSTQVGVLLDSQEAELTAALHAAFDLD